MSASKKRKNSTDDNFVLAPGQVQVLPAANFLYGIAYVDEKGDEKFHCLEAKRLYPGETCNSLLGNNKHDHSSHKSKLHPGQTLKGGGGNGGPVKQGLTRYQIKSEKIDIECKHCPGTKLSTPHALIRHYCDDKVKHFMKTTEEQIFSDYARLAYCKLLVSRQFTKFIG